MPRFPSLILCLTTAAAWSACSLIVTANPEGDGMPDDGEPDDGQQDTVDAREPLEDEEGLDPQPEDADGEDPSAEDVPEEAPPPPAGWTACPDSEGNSVWVRLMPASADHDTWSVAQEDCLTAIAAQEYFDFFKASQGYVEGLARITDELVFGCIEDVIRSNHDACLNPDSASDTCFYHVGLIQEAAGSEPDGGWHWTGYRDGGASPENLGYLETDHVTGIEDDFDDTSCSGAMDDSDCGLLKVRRLTDAWSTWFIDFRCVEACVPFQGICMISFSSPS